MQSGPGRAASRLLRGAALLWRIPFSGCAMYVLTSVDGRSCAIASERACGCGRGRVVKTVDGECPRERVRVLGAVGHVGSRRLLAWNQRTRIRRLRADHRLPVGKADIIARARTRTRTIFIIAVSDPTLAHRYYLVRLLSPCTQSSIRAAGKPLQDHFAHRCIASHGFWNAVTLAIKGRYGGVTSSCQEGIKKEDKGGVEGTSRSGCGFSEYVWSA